MRFLGVAFVLAACAPASAPQTAPVPLAWVATAAAERCVRRTIDGVDCVVCFSPGTALSCNWPAAERREEE